MFERGTEKGRRAIFFAVGVEYAAGLSTEQPVFDVTSVRIVVRKELE